MHNPSDEYLFNQVKHDDEHGLKLLFDRYFVKLVNTAYRLTSDKAIAQDLTQEVFIKFWSKRKNIALHSSLYAYLNRMLINEVLQNKRTHKSIQQLTDPAAFHIPDHRQTDDHIISAEVAKEVEQAIQGLPEKCAMVFKLSRYEQMSYREIAEHLNISIKTVENQISKALRHLRNKLKAHIYNVFL